jgi:hypothetical protein
MESERINYVVSPEVLNRDIFELNYDGNTFGLYSGMSQVLSSGINGSSLLTGLTVPILFTYSFNDLGFYDEFDGFIDQQDTINNFYISGNSIQPYQVTIYNTAGFGVNNYLALSNYSIDWGDGSNTSTVNIKENTQVHTYSQVPQDYSIKMTQNNIWGTTEIIKKITLPFTGVTVDNQLGTVTFTQQGGKWSGIPINYNYIFTGDSNSNLSSYYSSNYTQVPFIVSGFTNSKLNSLKRWGPQSFTVGYVINLGKESIGYVDEITSEYTSYTINNISYFDFNNGKTIYFVNSSGFTSNNLIISGLTKNELLLDFVFDPEIRSDVYVERGKYSGYEQLQRLGEVDNMGDLVRYGYGFFKINTV